MRLKETVERGLETVGKNWAIWSIFILFVNYTMAHKY